MSITLLIASLVVSPLLLEAGLRVVDFSYPSLGRPDDRLGRRLRENAEGWVRSEGEAFVRTNSAGFRDRERLVAKPPDVFRVAVLGDSYAEALQVDLENTFWSLLEKRLNACRPFGPRKVEVLNFGVAGYGTAQELLTYRYFASRFSPDLVLLAFFSGNDVRNNSRDLEPDKIRPFFVIKDGVLAEDSSFADTDEYRRRTSTLRNLLGRFHSMRILQAAYFAKDQIQLMLARRSYPGTGAPAEEGLDDAVYAAPTTTQWREAWTITERLLAQLRDESRASGAELVVVSLSTGIQVHPDASVRGEFMKRRGVTDLFYPDRRIEQTAKALGVRSILLAPRFQQFAEGRKIYLHGFKNSGLGMGHWNEAGHLLAAELIGDELCGGTDGKQSLPAASAR